MKNRKRKRMLFDIPQIIFDFLVIKLKIADQIKDFRLIWVGEETPAMYVILPLSSSYCRPTLMLVDLRQTSVKSVRMILLRNPPAFGSCLEIEDIKLDQYSSVEVGELASATYLVEKQFGSRIKLYLEFHSADSGVINITDERFLFLNLYSAQILSIVYDLYLDEKYVWVDEYIRDKNGNILPIKDNIDNDLSNN